MLGRWDRDLLAPLLLEYVVEESYLRIIFEHVCCVERMHAFWFYLSRQGTRIERQAHKEKEREREREREREARA